MAHTKVSPIGSTLVSSCNQIKTSITCGKVWGWLCMPICCAGFICLIPSYAFESMLTELKKIVALYTPEVLNGLAKDISREEDIFLKACTKVNETETMIFPNIRLIDVICAADQKASTMLMQYANTYEFTNKQQQHEYSLKVFDQYIINDGNSNVIIFGFPEYMARLYDVSSPKMTTLLKNLANKTQLHVYVFSHEDKA